MGDGGGWRSYLTAKDAKGREEDGAVEQGMPAALLPDFKGSARKLCFGKYRMLPASGFGIFGINGEVTL
jgi:hypothetical protein